MAAERMKAGDGLRKVRDQLTLILDADLPEAHSVRIWAGIALAELPDPDAVGECVEALRDLVPAMQAHSTQKALSREPGWEPPNLTRKLNTQYIPAAWAALAKLDGTS